MNAVVVVPFWRPLITGDEALSLTRCAQVLSRYPLVLLAPEGLSTGAMPLPPHAYAVERFAPHLFQGIAGYNRLMLSEDLYQRFAAYDYLLVHQMDAFVFDDRLREWCARGFDYVGAPWVGDAWPQGLSGVKRRLLRAVTTPATRVGNGGFSLRRVERFLHALRRLRPLAARWRSNEDLFWSVMARRLAGFRIPAAEEALSFSFELEPRRCYERLGRSLPFGCHAWPRYDPEFWRGVFQEIGARAAAPGPPS